MVTVESFGKVASEGLTKMVTPDLKTEGREGVSHEDIGEEPLLESGIGRCKGPEAGALPSVFEKQGAQCGWSRVSWGR